jgi:hypothetical protein
MTAFILRGEKTKFPVQMAMNCAILISTLAVWQFGMGSGVWTGTIKPSLNHRSGQRPGIFLPSKASKWDIIRTAHKQLRSATKWYTIRLYAS